MITCFFDSEPQISSPCLRWIFRCFISRTWQRWRTLLYRNIYKAQRKCSRLSISRQSVWLMVDKLLVVHRLKWTAWKWTRCAGMNCSIGKRINHWKVKDGERHEQPLFVTSIAAGTAQHLQLPWPRGWTKERIWEISKHSPLALVALIRTVLYWPRGTRPSKQRLRCSRTSPVSK